MRLSELLRDTGLEDEVGRDGVSSLELNDSHVAGVALESSKVLPGFVFAALPGRHTHGAMFARDAQTSGAIAVITDLQGRELLEGADLPTLVVANPRATVAKLAAALAGDPAKSLTMIGVTGTNGKTSVTHLVQAGLIDAGIQCGVVGTLGSALPGFPEVTHSRTTPEAPDLQQSLKWMVDHGAQAVSMEVSSIALQECRVDAITFDIAAFTGLTQDHLDYHGTMQAYFEAKAALFTPERARRAVVVIDDTWGRALVEQAAIPITTVSSVDRSADWFVSRSNGRVTLTGPEAVQVALPIPTDFAMTNVAVAVSVCHLLGVSTGIAAQAAVNARIPGRMEVVKSVDGMEFVVDYAHTPDAIRQVVMAAAASRRSEQGRVIVVVGAGGDRDASKREEMGEAASRGSDVLFITDDNPRSEDPAEIRAALVRGAISDGGDVRETASRAEAIERAVNEAAPGDIVLVLGKGHETTQEVAGHVLAFDDRVVLASFVERRFGGGEEGDQR